MIPSTEFLKPSLVNCPFAPNQEFFWADLNKWFAEMDEMPGSPTLAQGTKTKIPAELYVQMIGAMLSRYRALDVINLRANTDDKSLLNKQDLRPWLEYKESWEHEKTNALRQLSWIGNLRSEWMVELVQKAARLDDKSFFVKELPAALKKKGIYTGIRIGQPKKLSELLMGLWCGTTFRPARADVNLPPLCIFTDEALHDFLIFLNCQEGDGFSRTRKLRSRLGLRAIRKFRIRKVKWIKGKFLFS